MATKPIDIDKERTKLQGELAKVEADLVKMKEDFAQMSININTLAEEEVELNKKLEYLDELEAL